MCMCEHEGVQSEGPTHQGAQARGLRCRMTQGPGRGPGARLGKPLVASTSVSCSPWRPAAYLALTMFPALSSTISSNPTANMSAGLLSSGGRGRR